MLAVGLVAVASGAIALLLTRTRPSGIVGHDGVIEARRFVLIDAVGKRRAVLTAEGSGAASLYLTDAAGRPRATLGVGHDGSPASVAFLGPDRILRARLGLGANAASALEIFDENGGPVGHLP